MSIHDREYTYKDREVVRNLIESIRTIRTSEVVHHVLASYVNEEFTTKFMMVLMDSEGHARKLLARIPERPEKEVESNEDAK